MVISNERDVIVFILFQILSIELLLMKNHKNDDKYFWTAHLKSD